MFNENGEFVFTNEFDKLDIFIHLNQSKGGLGDFSFVTVKMIDRASIGNPEHFEHLHTGNAHEAIA